MKYTKEQIKKELEIVLQQSKVAESDLSKDEKFGKFIKLVTESEFQIISKEYANWIKWNVYSNDLPNNSSGSFLQAVIDFDNILSAFEGAEENEDELYYLVHDLWFREVLA